MKARLVLFVTVFSLGIPASRSLAQGAIPVGTARVDVTPEDHVRLVGYESRRTESEGVASRLMAVAIAIGGDPDAAVLVAVDNCAVGGLVVEEVAARLAKRAGLKRERLAVCSTHTHCAPGLTGTLDFILGGGLPADQRGRLAKYTAQLTDAIEKAALEALANRAPATLAWTQGRIDFAANRRVLKNGVWTGFGVNPSGPTDPSVPVLRAIDAQGKTKAILLGYACHCTTLGGEFNKICADWAGYARDEIEKRNPGATALVVIGCGADANPEPRRGLDDAIHHGTALGTLVDRLAKSTMTPLPGRIEARLKRLELPLEKPPSRAELVALATKPAAQGAFARSLLERLEKGETLPTTVPYVVQTWCFGDQMAMVFLAGEVVVDYSLRLKWEIGKKRLWINAYSNDVPCYIPSRRVLSEGGYEADFSMIYYGRPARFTPAIEDLITGAVHDLLPAPFDSPQPGE